MSLSSHDFTSVPTTKAKNAVQRDHLIQWTNDFLRLPYYDDFGPQGMQNIGRFWVEKIVTAVSPSSGVITKAANMGADMLITHHSLYWHTEPHVIDDRVAMRMEDLEKWGLSFASYHLCLDAHEVVGNNILTARLLGIYNPKKFADIGWGGKLENPISLDRLYNKLSHEVNMGGEVVYIYPKGKQPINRVAITTGDGSRMIYQAKREGYDALITGEPTEQLAGLATDLKMNVICAGHNATERIGIKALGRKIAARFGIEHEFLAQANPV